MTTPARREQAAELMRRWQVSREDLDEAADVLGYARLTDEEWDALNAAPP